MAQNAARLRKGRRMYNRGIGFSGHRYVKYSPKLDKLFTKQNRRTILENFNHLRFRH